MVQLSYIKELLDNDLDCHRALNGELVLVELAEDQLQLPVFSYIIQLLVPGKNVLAVLGKFSFISVARQVNADGMDLRDIYFIDCVSRRRHLDHADSDHVVELEAATQLKTVFGTLLDQTDVFAKNSVACVDDLASLQRLSAEGEFPRLFHLLLTKLRNKNVGGVLMVERESINHPDYAELKQLVDKVVHI